MPFIYIVGLILYYFSPECDAVLCNGGNLQMTQSPRAAPQAGHAVLSCPHECASQYKGERWTVHTRCTLAVDQIMEDKALQMTVN